jgi:hypothetical protein
VHAADRQDDPVTSPRDSRLELLEGELSSQFFVVAVNPDKGIKAVTPACKTMISMQATSPDGTMPQEKTRRLPR